MFVSYVSYCVQQRFLSLFGFEAKPKQKVMGKPVKTPTLNWMEALPPPPPPGELEQNDELPEHEDMDIG